MKIVALAIVLFIFALTATASRRSESLRKHVKLGKYAAETRDYDRAVKHYKEALKTSPGSKEVLFTLGALYQKTGEYDKAKNIYKKIIDMHPLDANARLCLGDLYLAQNKLDYAVGELQKATELDRENSAAYRNLGFAQLLGGAYYSASKSLERAVALNTNDALACFDLGVAYSKLGKSKKATRIFQKGLAINNSFAGKETYTKVLEDCEGEVLTAAISAFNNNNFKKAEKEIRNLIRDYPDHALLYVYLGHTLHFKRPAEPFAAEMAYRKALRKLKYTVLTPLQMAYLLDNLGMMAIIPRQKNFLEKQLTKIRTIPWRILITGVCWQKDNNMIQQRFRLLKRRVTTNILLIMFLHMPH